MQNEWDSRDEGMLGGTSAWRSMGSGDGGTIASVMWRKLKVGKVQEEP